VRFAAVESLVGFSSGSLPARVVPREADASRSCVGFDGGARRFVASLRKAKCCSGTT